MSNWLYALRRDVRALEDPEIPERFQDATLTGIQHETIRTAVTEYTSQFFGAGAQGIAPLFIGRAQSWKSYAAAYLTRMVQANGIQSRFVQVKPLLERWELLKFSDGRMVLNEFTRLIKVPFLVMDDFTMATPAPSWQASQLMNIAEQRFASLRPTLWTGNVTISRSDTSLLDQLYGAAFTRRIMDASVGYRVLVK